MMQIKKHDSTLLTFVSRFDVAYLLMTITWNSKTKMFSILEIEQKENLLIPTSQ